ncbi:MAG TPA: hypothetical protein VLO11_04605, partial [Luteolibacter sp.]|nr:hypothetical protein [Luteolibacter sp.]
MAPIVHGAAALALLALPAHGGVIATDTAVPAVMDASGTEADPAQYIVGNSGPVSVDFGTTSLTVGNFNSRNQLIVRNGSTVTHLGLSMGLDLLSSHNLILVEGAGSQLIRRPGDHEGIGARPLYIGTDVLSSDNLLHIRDGGMVVGEALRLGNGGFSSTNNSPRNACLVESGGSFATDGPFVGAGAVVIGDRAEDCSLTVRGSGTSFTATGNNKTVSVGYGASGTGNILSVSDGAVFTCETLTCGDFGSVNNLAIISDTGTVLTTEDLVIGRNSAAGNIFRIENGALLVVNRNSASQLQGLSMNEVSATGNLLQLKGGFLAWNGDHVADIAALVDEIEVWNGTAYETANGSAFFDVTYFADDTSAKAATADGGFAGYDGLGGYTLL